MPNWFGGAFVDVAYGYSSNSPANHLMRGQWTTPRTGEFTLNTVAVHATHEATDEEPYRLELALQAGASVDAIYAPEPVPGGADGRFAGAEVFKHIGRANAGLLVRKSGTEIRGGLMASPVGIGSAWTKLNWNYTTSWAANATPYYLMGGMIHQALPRDFAIEVWVVNGWQTIADANAVPSYLASLIRARGNWLLTSQVYFGPEGTDLAPEAWRVHWDTFAQYEGARWGIGGLADFGQERLTTQPGSPQALWLLGAAFVHGVVWESAHASLDLAARPEIMWDRDGLLHGVRQIMIGETVTLGARLWDHLLVRLEYRYDRSSAEDGFFYRNLATADTAALASTQHTIFASMVGYYERGFRLRRNGGR